MKISNMKKWQKRVLFILAAAVVVVWLIIAALVLNVAWGANLCPPGGPGWTKIDSGNLSSYPVSGATKYCFKAGPYIVGSIPAGGFGQEGACEEEHIERCGLSHWAYYIPEDPTDTPEIPTNTPTPEEPTPTDTPEDPTPTDTPEGPTPTPTETPEGPTPTPTDTPEDPTMTPTHCDTPTITPTRKRPKKTPTLPYTGLVLYEMSAPEEAIDTLDIPTIGVHTSVWSAPYTEYMGWDIGGIGDQPAMLEGTHAIAGHLYGMFYDLYQLEPGDRIIFNGSNYTMIEERFVDPFDMDVLEEGDLVLFTCSWWTGSTYRYRRVIIAELSH